MFDPSCSSPGYADGGPVPEPDTNQISKILVHMKDDKSGGPPGTPSAEGPAQSSGADPDLVMAASDLADATKSGDPDAIASAFQAMFDICDSKDYGEKDEGDEGSEPDDSAGPPTKSGNPFAGKE